MNKLEVKEFLKVKLNEGYITHPVLLEIYKDDEIIPDDMLNIMYSIPKEREYVIFCGIELGKKINDMFLKDYR